MEKADEQRERITIWWPASDIAKLKAAAATDGISAADFLLSAFNEHVARSPKDLQKALDVIAQQSKKSGPAGR
ncbi:MAG: hypothetical protein WCX65_06650 [bacterium]